LYILDILNKNYEISVSKSLEKINVSVVQNINKFSCWKIL